MRKTSAAPAITDHCHQATATATATSSLTIWITLCKGYTTSASTTVFIAPAIAFTYQVPRKFLRPVYCLRTLYSEIRNFCTLCLLLLLVIRISTTNNVNLLMLSILMK